MMNDFAPIAPARLIAAFTRMLATGLRSLCISKQMLRGFMTGSSKFIRIFYIYYRYELSSFLSYCLGSLLMPSRTLKNASHVYFIELATSRCVTSNS